MKQMTRWPRISITTETEEIAVDMIQQLKVPDEKWNFVDKAGHGHFWKGKKIPTCKLVVTGSVWVGDEFEAEEIEVKEWKCKICGEIVEPGYRYESSPTHVPGLTWVALTIDDESFVLTPDEYAASVDVWREALREMRR